MRRITLSFDNGPDPEVTPAVLDTLARHGIRTTFFVVGRRLAAGRAASERAQAEGHWIGNHTWSHSRPFRDGGDAAFVRAEIDRTQAALGPLAHPDRLFRPYGGQGRLEGALNAAAVAHLERGLYTCVLWNVVPGDWKDPDGWPETALRQIEATTSPREIKAATSPRQIEATTWPREIEAATWPLVVLHDVSAAAMRHLDGFIRRVADRGYAFEQSFPPDCIALHRGRPTAILDRGVVEN